MTPTDWRALFDEAHPEPGLRAEVLAPGVIEGYLFAPLTPDEVKEAQARQDERVDPAAFALPDPAARPLPPSYKAFLGWSNGGVFITGSREFQMLRGQELREYLLLYDLPTRMPGVVPFASDGAGGFYLFDLREPPDVAGEYPVLHATGDRLTFAGATRLGSSLVAALRDRGEPG